MRVRVDDSWQRFARVVMAGSPLRLFRLTPAGVVVAERVEAGAHVERSTLIDRWLDSGAIHPIGNDDLAPLHTIGDVTVVTPQFGGVAHDDGRVTIDDGSTPPIAGATARLAFNRGPAAARNAARPLIDSTLVAFLDADVATPDPHWLDALLWHFDDPTVALVAPRVRGEKGSPLDLGERPARIRSGTRVSYVPSAAMIVRVDALDQIGWFDELLRFGEDVDLVWRLDQAGWKCRYDPSVSVWHRPRESIGQRLRQHADYGSSAAPLALRHPAALTPIHMNGWTVAAWVLLLAGRWRSAVALAAGSSAAMVHKVPDVPASATAKVAMRGQLLAGRQLAASMRREWWPLMALGALVSRRCRWVALIAIVSDLRATPTDLAYGWGVWSSMRRMRTWAPIVPRLSAWPERRRR